jgi:uncharacterized protein YutE (UPF0331/DUF86 family)
MNMKELHDREVSNVAERYRQRGYDVIIEPAPQQIPKFLKDLRPDLIATKGHDHVVVEVKAREALRNSDSARQMADLVGKEPNWRFELVLLSNQSTQLSNYDTQPLPIARVKDLIARARQERESGDAELAFMTAWIAAEAVLRLFAAKNGLTNPIWSPAALLKQLVFEGAISREQFNALNGMQVLRNRVVHGFQPPQISKETFDLLIEITEALLAEAANDVTSRQ